MKNSKKYIFTFLAAVSAAHITALYLFNIMTAVFSRYAIAKINSGGDGGFLPELSSRLSEAVKNMSVTLDWVILPMALAFFGLCFRKNLRLAPYFVLGIAATPLLTGIVAVALSGGAKSYPFWSTNHGRYLKNIILSLLIGAAVFIAYTAVMKIMRKSGHNTDFLSKLKDVKWETVFVILGAVLILMPVFGLVFDFAGMRSAQLIVTDSDAVRIITAVLAAYAFTEKRPKAVWTVILAAAVPAVLTVIFMGRTEYVYVCILYGVMFVSSLLSAAASAVSLSMCKKE